MIQLILLAFLPFMSAAQTYKDSVTISERVTDFNDNPVNK
jgi:hypothetical protein